MMLLLSLHNLIELLLFFLYFTILGGFIQIIVFNQSVTINKIVQLNIIGLFFHFVLIAILNIFIPIDARVFLLTTLILLVSLRGVIQNISLHNLKMALKIKYILPFSIYFFFLFWISNLGLGELKYEPMYFIQKIRWAQQFPLIPGLGNLFDHYGLDSGHFLQLAVLDSLPFMSHSFWNFSGYLLALGFLYFFVKPIYSMLNDKRSLRYSDLMRLLFVPILIHNCFYMHPGLGPDLPVFIFGSILAVEMFRMFFERKENLDIILICALLGFSSKMSFLPTATLSIVAILLVYFRNIGNLFQKQKLIILLVLLSFSLQIHRNIMLTGYPLYPFEHISLSTKWKMDGGEVSKISKGIFNWAKGIRGETKPEEMEIVKKEWMKSRFLTQHRRIETFYPLLLGLVGLVFVAFSKQLSRKKIGIFMIPVVGQLGMWYFYSPDTRVASFAFWWFGAGLICFPLKDFIPYRFLSSFSVLVLLFSFSLHTIDAFGQDKELYVLKPSEFVPASLEASIYTTNSGLEIWVPDNEGKCDDIPIPCTQNFDPKLRLINDENIASGFLKIH